MNPRPYQSWQCASCGRVFNSVTAAEECCVCCICGGHAGDGRVACCDCIDSAYEKSKAEKIANYKRVPWDEYDGAGVYIEGVGREYCWGVHPEEIIDFWESYEEEPFPGFGKLTVLGVYAEPIELHPDDLAEHLNDGAYEDYEVDGRMMEDLERLCAEWNAKHADKTYWPDSVVVTYEGCDEI